MSLNAWRITVIEGTACPLCNAKRGEKCWRYSRGRGFYRGERLHQEREQLFELYERQQRDEERAA